MMRVLTSFADEKVKDPAGLAPPKLVPGLHQALVLGVHFEVGDLVALPMVEAHRAHVARNDDVGPVAAAGQQQVVAAHLKSKQRLAIILSCSKKVFFLGK